MPQLRLPRTRNVALILLGALALLIAACSGGESDTTSAAAATTSAPEPSPTPEPVEPEATEEPAPTLADVATATAEAPTPTPEPVDEFRWQTGTSEYLFNQNALHTFEITMTEEALAFLDADPGAEEYVEGVLSFEGEVVGTVGVRYKGSIGAFVNCLDGPNPFVPSGNKLCSKLSMKIKINWDGADRTFYGVKKLQLHSMNNDPSQMRERLGYWLFREMGAPAPRATHARLEINGEFAGLFALVENIDGRFARDTFDDGTGNVYKEVWPFDMNSTPLAEQDFIDGLRTNEDENPNAQIIVSMAEQLSAAETVEDRQAVLESYAVIDELIAYAAVDRTIAHDDGPFHWYCLGDGPNNTPCSPHNFFIYEDPTAETIHLIAWDLDNAFENIPGPINFVTPIADAWGETREDCEQFSFGGFGLPQISAACEPFTATMASYETEYADARLRLVNGPLSEESVQTQLEIWSAQIAEATAEAEAAFKDAITMDEWEASMAKLTEDLDLARDMALNPEG